MHQSCFILSIASILSACAQTQMVKCDTPLAEAAYQTGAQGKKLNKVLELFPKQCRQAKSQTNVQLYQQQYQQGIKTYCTQNQAIQLGLDGKPYEGVCEQDFTQAYLKGKKRYELQQKIHQKDSDNNIPTFNNAISPRHFEH